MRSSAERLGRREARAVLGRAAKERTKACVRGASWGLAVALAACGPSQAEREVVDLVSMNGESFGRLHAVRWVELQRVAPTAREERGNDEEVRSFGGTLRGFTDAGRLVASRDIVGRLGPCLTAYRASLAALEQGAVVLDPPAGAAAASAAERVRAAGDPVQRGFCALRTALRACRTVAPEAYVQRGNAPWPQELRCP